jgi:hypothetical protein
VARAHCGSPIFAEDDERAFVVERAARAFAETGATCLGWAVLDNHYHVLLRCEGPPGPTFARLNTAIAWRALRHRGEHGAVFQNRFYSDPCADEDSLLTRLAYVLGNPVHHRVVPTVGALRTHPWSGLGEVLGLEKSRWTDVDATLALVDSDRDRARRALVRFLEARAAEWAVDGGDPREDRGLRVTPETGAGEGLIVVPPPPTLDVPTALALSPPAEPVECVRNVLRSEGWTPARLLPVACILTGADSTLVAAGARTPAETAARGVVAHVACDAAGCTMVEAAAILGVGPTALLRARPRGRALLARVGMTAAEILERSRGTW